MSRSVSKKLRAGKRFFSLILVFSLVLGACACQKIDDTEATGATQTENQATQTDVEIIAALLRDVLDEYQIVRSETMEVTELSVLLSFIDVLRQNGYSSVRPVNDFTKLVPVQDKEIVVGQTTRAGSVYSLGSEPLVKGDSYAIYIIEQRLIFSYDSLGGMMDGLEFLLLAILSGQSEHITESFTLALFERDKKRYEYSGFSINNVLMSGMKLSAKEALSFSGKAGLGDKVELILTNNGVELQSAQTVVGDDGKWAAKLPPDIKATELTIRVNDILVERYSDIEFVEDTLGRASNGMRVFIDDEEIGVFETPAGLYAIASVRDMSKLSMTVKIVRNGTISECTVRPQNDGIKPTVSGNTVNFTVNEFPSKLLVEFDRFATDRTDGIQIFLYGQDSFEPNAVDGKLMYFARGEYWEDHEITLESNTFVYLEEGAILHARFNTEGKENITIAGRGIIDTYYFKVETDMMQFMSCKNLIFKDYTLTGPRKWMLVLKNSNDVAIEGMNIIGTEINSDGIDIVGSSNVSIANCYIRSNDDCIAIKSHGNNVSSVRVRGCVLWNMEYGNAIEIGYETRCESISNILFEDNDIIRIEGGCCMSIHLGDRAAVSNVTYQDIRVEEVTGTGYLIEMFIKETRYSQDTVRGSISDVKIKNIEILGDVIGKIALSGFGPSNVIRNVEITNVVRNDSVLPLSRLNISVNSYVSGATYNGSSLN